MFGAPNSNRIAFINPATASSGGESSNFDQSRLRPGAAFIGPGRPNLFGVNLNLNPNFSLYSSNGNQGASESGSEKSSTGGNQDSSSSGNNSGNSGNGKGHGRKSRGKGKNNPKQHNPSFVLEGRDSLLAEWNSGITNDMLYNNSDQGDDEFSPLFIAHGQLFPRESNTDSTRSESFVSGFMDNELYQYYRDIVARNSSIASSRHFKKEIFLSYLHEVIRCVQIFYSVDVILTLYSHGCDNQGIKMLRMRVDESAASQFMKLSYELQKHFLPSRIVEYVRGLYQAYSASTEPNAPIFMLSYKDIWTIAEDNSCVEGSIESTILSDCLDRLQSAQFSELRTILAQSLPDHRIKLNPCFDRPLVSNNYLTFWHNQTCLYFNVDPSQDKVVSTASVSSREETFKYFTIQDSLDVSYLALKTIFRDHKYSSGLWEPHSVIHNSSPNNYINVSRLSDGTLKRSMTEELTSACGISRIPYYDNDNEVFSVITRPTLGSKKSLFMSEERIQLAAEHTIRYLFNIEPGR